jgi:hypothetical protein
MQPREWQWWDERKRTAFLLLDSGEYTQAKVAAAVGVTRRVVEGWARRPQWRKLAGERNAEMRRQLDANFAHWKAERERVGQEFVADYERQLQNIAARDIAWYKRPDAASRR